jgi:hypothetical protein
MRTFLTKAIRKELSRFRHKNGVKITDFFEKFKSLPGCVGLDLNFMKKLLESDKNIKIDTSTTTIRLEDEYLKGSEFSQFENELYNYKYITNLFKEENNVNILAIYRIICDNNEMNYLDISKSLEALCSNIKLDIKQVAHYCKELKLMNLIKSDLNIANNNERIITRKGISYDTTESVLPEPTNSDEENLIEKMPINTKSTSLSTVRNPFTVLELSENDIAFIKGNDFIDKYVLDNRFTFTVDDDSIQNNILFHLALKDNSRGLTLNEITLLLGMLGREKCIGRVLNNMVKDKLLMHKAIRDGKKYEYQYFINDEKELAPNIKYYLDLYLTTKTSKVTKPHTLSNKADQPTPIKKEASSHDKAKKKDNEFVELNDIDFKYIVDLIAKDPNYLSLNNKYKETNFNENKFNILLDFFNSISSITANKSFSNISFNRYLFCLNMIREKVQLSSIDLKHLIVEKLENKKDYIIDRKTLKKILVNLESLGMIKILEYEITMKNKEYSYVKKDEIKQSKVVILSRDVELTSELLDEIEGDLKTNKPKKVSSSVLKMEDYPESSYTPSKLEVKAESTPQDDLIHMPDLDMDIDMEDLKITSRERNVRELVGKLVKLEEKYNNKDMIKVFFFKLKKMTFLTKNIKEIFNFNKNPEEILLHEILENKALSKVIIPRYLAEKYISRNTHNNISNNRYSGTIDNLINDNDLMDIDDGGMDNETHLRKFTSFNANELINLNETIKLWNKSGLNKPTDADIALVSNKLMTSSEKDLFIKPKQDPIAEGTDVYKSLTMLKRKKGKSGKFDRKADLMNILSKIYFTPKITIKKLRNSFPSNHEACIDFLMYFKKHGLLNISKKNDNEISFQLDEAITNYLKF